MVCLTSEMIRCQDNKSSKWDNQRIREMEVLFFCTSLVKFTCPLPYLRVPSHLNLHFLGVWYFESRAMLIKGEWYWGNCTCSGRLGGFGYLKWSDLYASNTLYIVHWIGKLTNAWLHPSILEFHFFIYVTVCYKVDLPCVHIGHAKPHVQFLFCGGIMSHILCVHSMSQTKIGAPTL